MNYIVFFSYKLNKETTESMAIVKASNNTEAGEKFNRLSDKRRYEELHVWWIDELERTYGESEVIAL